MHSRSLTSVFVLGFALLFSANSVYSLPINARSAGIGFSSVAAFELEGIYSVNPAALSLSKNVGILFQQDPRFPDEDHANYSYSDRLNTYGVHYPVTTKLSIGLHSQRFKQNRFLGENNYTQKTNSYFDVIGLSISGRIISNLRLGMSLNWMSSKTDVYFVSALSSLTAVEKNYTDSYYDMDLGALYQKQIYSSGTFVAKYSLGFTINNLGGNSKENELQAYRNTHLGTAVSIRWNTPLAILTSVEVTPTVEWHSYAKENYPSAGVLPNPFSAGLDALRSEVVEDPVDHRRVQADRMVRCAGASWKRWRAAMLT